MAYKDITPPAGGKITIANGKLNVPHNPIIPFIRGDAVEVVFRREQPNSTGGTCTRVPINFTGATLN